MDNSTILQLEPFSLSKNEKDAIILPLLNELNKLHFERSEIYKKIVNTIFAGLIKATNIYDIPFIPVSVFKRYEIKSISDSDIYKVLTSSGTTGQSVSKIYLDKGTAKLQTLALSKIISHIVGKQRLPMLIIDSKSIFSNHNSFSARAAGILGLSVFGKDHTYALDENFQPQEHVLDDFFKKYCNRPILIFGFTFMLWEFLINKKHKKNYDLSQAILIHSGGWKKMIDISVDNNIFRKSFKNEYNISQIFNFYGMVEQVGSIFLENRKGFLHCPNFADIIIRNPKDFSVQPFGKPGLIQVLSTIPHSYPGHSLLTEDIGVIEGENLNSTEWSGKYFRVIGRATNAELRGCSDTFNNK